MLVMRNLWWIVVSERRLVKGTEMKTLEQHLKPSPTKRVLALDGGGVRGLISLGILGGIERELAKRTSDPNKFVLSDYFDLIAGTSTGSIIATGLAMGMKVEKLANLYKSEAPSIFPRTRRKGFFVPKYDASPLERLLEQIVGNATLESDAFKTGLLICAKRMDTDSAWVLTNNPNSVFWESSDGSYTPNKDYKVRMLVRASAAAPTFFSPVRIDVSSGDKRFKEEIGVFVDGAISGHNSPALQAILTAVLPSYGFNWQVGSDRLLLISVGTGWRRERRDAKSLLKAKPVELGISALQGLINDTVKNDLTLLQAMSDSQSPWKINTEIGDLSSQFLSDKPLFSFQRYDVSLSQSDIVSALKIETEKDRVKKRIAKNLLNMSDATKSNLRACESLGHAAALNVKPDHFPSIFDSNHTVCSEPINPPENQSGSTPEQDPASFGRLEFTEQIDEDTFRALATQRRAKIGKYQKTGLVAATEAKERIEIVTYWNGEETRNIAERGDMIVTSLTNDFSILTDDQGQQNTYTMKAGRFAKLYQASGFASTQNKLGWLYRAKGQVYAFHVPEGFQIKAPWGEMQNADNGYIVLNGSDVYGVHSDVFEETYAEI